MGKQVLIVLAFIALAFSHQCLDQNGQSVDWWVILKVPPKIGKSGFGYYDARSTSSQFSYVSTHVDDKRTALTYTLLQINSENLESVAWNDEKPTGQTSTTLAHSKSIIAYSRTLKKGFFIDHSLPKYPAFINNQVNITIAPAQNYYGQHLMCISMSLPSLNVLASKLVITRPYIYQRNVINSSETHYLADLANSESKKVSENFQYNSITVSNNIKMIFKNGFNNCSIFEDGLTNYLSSSLIVQSWGRPLQKQWCTSKYSVTNVQNINLSGQATWGQPDDHSKWAYAESGNNVCFGDMNRMESQWKRGGSFYCIDSSSLHLAVRNIITSSDKC